MEKFKFKIEGTDYEVVINDVENNIAAVEVNGKSYTVEIEKEEVVKTPIKRNISPGRSASAPAPAAKKPVASGGANTLNSPLPGTILKVAATVGQQVKAGDVVLIMESMKMENNILANSDGTVKNVFVAVGQSVMQGESLVEIG
jgi:biotin carboxyl carrier protein